ncbi:MAG: hypothetical protein HY720_15205 [Planctomycetes bacterium]|nr:hypothetical protein [Planctomycetota bacterium]
MTAIRIGVALFLFGLVPLVRGQDESAAQIESLFVILECRSRRLAFISEEIEVRLPESVRDLVVAHPEEQVDEVSNVRDSGYRGRAHRLERRDGEAIHSIGDAERPLDGLERIFLYYRDDEPIRPAGEGEEEIRWVFRAPSAVTRQIRVVFHIPGELGDIEVRPSFAIGDRAVERPRIESSGNSFTFLYEGVVPAGTRIAAAVAWQIERAAARERAHAALREALAAAERASGEEELEVVLGELERAVRATNHWHEGWWELERLLRRLYAGRVERGVAFLGEICDRDVSPRGGHPLEELLLDLAIEAGRFELALDLARARRTREDYPGRAIEFARIHAARGARDEALRELRTYLDYPPADSRTRVLVLDEFHGLHADPEFRELVAETPATVREGTPGFEEDPGPPPSMEKLARAAADYDRVRTAEDLPEHIEAIQAADALIRPHAARCSRELIELLSAKDRGPFYRVAIAMHLAGIGDAALAREAARAVRAEEIRPFPRSLFWFSYLLARADPEAARPFLLELLAARGGSMDLPAHAMVAGWSTQVFVAFGVAEAASIEWLLDAARGAEEAIATEALDLLVQFQEPRAVPILVDRWKLSPPGDARQRALARLVNIGLPDAARAVDEVLSGLPPDAGERADLESARDRIGPPPEDTLPARGDRAIEDPEMKRILLQNLALTYGRDTSFIEAELFATVGPGDLAALQRIRSRILFRFSDEAWSDWQTVSTMMAWLRWKE